MNLGAALASIGRGTEAAAVLRAGASLDGSGLKDKRAHEAARVQALLQLGALYADQGRLQRALSAYREALHALPDHYPPQVSVQVICSLLLHLRRAATYRQAAALRIPAFPLTNRLPSNRFVKGICTIDFTGNYATSIFSDRVSCYLTRKKIYIPTMKSYSIEVLVYVKKDRLWRIMPNTLRNYSCHTRVELEARGPCKIIIRLLSIDRRYDVLIVTLPRASSLNRISSRARSRAKVCLPV